MESLKGKKVLLIGASGGIGMRLAKLLTGSGAIVFITGRNREKLAVAGEQAGIPSNRQFQMDLTHEAAVYDTIGVIQQDGPIDILINAAGIGIIKSMDTLTTEDFINTLQVNLIGSFWVTKAVLAAMKEAKKGLIIHIPGVLGKVPIVPVNMDLWG